MRPEEMRVGDDARLEEEPSAATEGLVSGSWWEGD
jgi:hypothetical protein